MSNDPNRLKSEQAALGHGLRRAVELFQENRRERTYATPPACVPLPRLRTLAIDPASEQPAETFHLQHCGVCRDDREQIRRALAATEATDVPMAMPEGGIARGMMSFGVMLTAIRNATDISTTTWGPDRTFNLLNDLKKCALEAELFDRATSRYWAGAYARAVEFAPVEIKVVMVYGLIVFHDVLPFAMDVAREIAKRDDPVAQRVLVFTLCTEEMHLIKAIDCKRWSEIFAIAASELKPYQDEVNTALKEFEAAIQPPHTLANAGEVFQRTTERMTGAMIHCRAEATILRLLSLRQYLGYLAAHAHDTCSDIAMFFPHVTNLVYATARHHGALPLAMEACERLRIPKRFETLIEKLVDFEKAGVGRRSSHISLCDVLSPRAAARGTFFLGLPVLDDHLTTHKET